MDAGSKYFFENGEFRMKFSKTVELLSPENAPEFSILGVTQLVVLQTELRCCGAFTKIACNRLLHGLMGCTFRMKILKHQGALFPRKDHFGQARWTTTRIKAIA